MIKGEMTISITTPGISKNSTLSKITLYVSVTMLNDTYARCHYAEEYMNYAYHAKCHGAVISKCVLVLPSTPSSRI
jgi:hypothetical protein